MNMRHVGSDIFYSLSLIDRYILSLHSRPSRSGPSVPKCSNPIDRPSSELLGRKVDYSIATPLDCQTYETHFTRTRF